MRKVCQKRNFWAFRSYWTLWLNFEKTVFSKTTSTILLVGNSHSFDSYYAQYKKGRAAITAKLSQEDWNLLLAEDFSLMLSSVHCKTGACKIACTKITVYEVVHQKTVNTKTWKTDYLVSRCNQRHLSLLPRKIGCKTKKTESKVALLS